MSDHLTSDKHISSHGVPHQLPFVFPLVIAKPPQPQVCLDTIELLRSMLKQAESGELHGIAAVVLHQTGSFRLVLEGEALIEGNQMSVLGMLVAL